MTKRVLSLLLAYFVLVAYLEFEHRIVDPEKLEEERKSMIFPSDSSGFGLIELLIVVAIIGIVAAAALLPLSGAKIAAYKAQAISGMRQWVPQKTNQMMDRGLDLDRLENRLERKLAQLQKKQANIEEKLQAIDLVKKAWEELEELGPDSELTQEQTAAAQEETASTEQEATVTLEDAIGEVVKIFKHPLSPCKITEELVAVGYPFETKNPFDSIDAALERMLQDGKIKQIKTGKGNLFALSAQLVV